MKGAPIVWRIAGWMTVIYIVVMVGVLGLVLHGEGHLHSSEWLWVSSAILATALGSVAFFRLSAGKRAGALLAAYATATITLIVVMVGVPAYFAWIVPFSDQYSGLYTSDDVVPAAILGGVLSLPLVLAAIVRWKRVGKKIGLVFAGIIVVGLILHAGLNIYTSRKVGEEIRKIRERGEPISWDELVGVSVPEEEDAAPLYEEIDSLLQVDNLYRMSTESGDIWELDYSEWTEEQREEILAILANHERVFDLLHEASLRPQSSVSLVHIDEDSPVHPAAISMDMGQEFTESVKLLSMRSALEKARGEMDTALERVSDGFAVAGAVGRTRCIVGFLVRRICEEIVLNRLESLLTDREISWGSYERVYDVLRKQRGSWEDDLVSGFLGERCLMMTIDEYMKQQNYLLRPFIRLSYADYLRHNAGLLERVRRPYWEIKDVPPPEGGPMYEGALSRVAASKARLGTAELAVALRMHKSKTGSYPASLNELVPGTVEELPLDPFTGRDFVYREEEKGFVVYSLGKNGKDDGGKWDASGESTEDVVWKFDE